MNLSNNDQNRPHSNFGVLWLLVCLAITAALVLAASPDSTASSRPSTKGRTLKPIEQVKLGERVHVELPDRLKAGIPDSQFDPATWRTVQLKLTTFEDVEVDVVLLRPIDWLESNGIQVGAEVQLELSEVELSGFAKIISISACPPISSGDGRVVTGTFRHVHEGIYSLYLEGSRKPLGVTGNHPIYSLDRDDFIPVKELQVNELVRSLVGPQHVQSLSFRADTQPVFNLEVDGDHVYHVGGTGLLVHNICPTEFFETPEFKAFNAEPTGSRYTYRLLNPIEVPEKGLDAKAPEMNRKLQTHVRMGSRIKTQFISTGRNLFYMLNRWASPGQRLVKIDLAKLGDNAKIYDLTTETARQNLLGYQIVRNFARASGEIVIEGHIPPEAIVDMIIIPGAQ